MAGWQFYLQKRGDRAWLHLETNGTTPASIEIGAGEYRLVVKCQYKQTLVHLRLQYEAEGAPQIEEYEKWTNPDGLMVVMPFRELSVGQWHIECLIVPLNLRRQVQLVVVQFLSVPEPSPYLLQLAETEFTVNDRGMITLPMVLEGTGELAVQLKHPDTLQTVLDIRRYLWQGGKLNLEIAMPPKPPVAVLMGTVQFGDQCQAITVTYPPHILPPNLCWQELPPLVPKINPHAHIAPYVPTTDGGFDPALDRLMQFKHGLDHGQSAPMDEEFCQLLPQLEVPPPAKPRRLPNVFTPPAHSPLSAPILDIPEGELIAGIPIPIMAYLPASAEPQSIKLWLKDCQTRCILDGPRWLVDFENHDGTLESHTQITVPLGCMEVAFEAVTIDLHNQRQSYKIRTIRKVTPPHMA